MNRVAVPAKVVADPAGSHDAAQLSARDGFGLRRLKRGLYFVGSESSAFTITASARRRRIEPGVAPSSRENCR